MRTRFLDHDRRRGSARRPAVDPGGRSQRLRVQHHRGAAGDGAGQRLRGEQGPPGKRTGARLLLRRADDEPVESGPRRVVGQL
ncbi:hypothetical protein KPATCC21470_2940 [Kitasatospora purpeofusca]